MSDYCTLKTRLFYKACGVLEAIYLNLGTFKKGICSVIAWLDIMHIQAVLKLRGTTLSVAAVLVLMFLK